MIRRWQGVSRSTRMVVSGIVVVLLYGTVIHVLHLIGGGFAPYAEMPAWLRVYFVSLTLLDPLAAVLLARRRRSGVVLVVVVFVSDAAANGWANYAVDPAPVVTAGRLGQAVITALALGVCAVAPRLWRCARARGSSRTDAGARSSRSR